MAEYNITSPDGKQYKVTAPEGASQADILAYVKRQQPVNYGGPVGEAGDYLSKITGTILKRGMTDLPKFFGGAIQKAGDELERNFPITPDRMKIPIGNVPEAIDAMTGGTPREGRNIPEKLAIEAGAGAVGGGMLGGVPAAIGGAGGGLGGEVGEMIAPNNPLAKILAALLGGAAAGPAAYKATGGGAARRINEVTRGVPDARLADARDLMLQGQKEGVRLNLPQAMDQQPNSLTALSEDAARSSAAPAHTARQVQQNAQAQQAGKKATGLFALPDADPTTVAGKTAEAATAAVKRADKLPATVAKEDYSFTTKMATPQEMKGVIGDLQDAVERIGPTTSAGKFLQNEVLGKLYDKKAKGNILDLEQLKTILNEAKAAIDKPTLKTPGLEGRSAAQTREALEGTLENFLSGKMVNKAQGDEIYKQVHQDIIDPMKRSPVGQIAGPAGFDPEAVTKVDQIFKVIDSPNIRSQTISKMQVDLDKSAPGTFAQYVKTGMDRKLDAAFKKSDLSAPTAFVQALRGAPGAGVANENFRASMAAAARSQGKSPQQAAEFVNGMGKLLDVIEAAGRNKVIATQAQGKNPALDIATDVAKGVTYTPQAPGAVSRIIGNMMGTDANRKKIFDMIWTPEGVDQIRKYAAMDIPGVRNAFLAGAAAEAGVQGER